MSRFVADTHALAWHLTNDLALSAVARDVMQEADRGVDSVPVPGIILVEMIYLVER